MPQSFNKGYFKSIHTLTATLTPIETSVAPRLPLSNPLGYPHCIPQGGFEGIPWIARPSQRLHLSYPLGYPLGHNEAFTT